MAEEKKKYPRLMVINEPDGRRFSRALAMEIGRDHAEVFLQIEFLISISSTPPIDGKLWTRESIQRLQMNHFPYWGKTFIANILNDLVSGYEHTRYEFSGFGRTFKRIPNKVSIPPLLIREWHNQWGTDSTWWYALNPEGIASLSSVKLDADAVTAVSATRKPVSAKRKQVSQNAETGFQTSGNGLPDMRQPVAPHAATFITEIPTETPTERGARENADSVPPPPPNFPDVVSLEAETKKGSNQLDIVATRTNNLELMKGLFNGE